MENTTHHVAGRSYPLGEGPTLILTDHALAVCLARIIQRMELMYLYGYALAQCAMERDAMQGACAELEQQRAEGFDPFGDVPRPADFQLDGPRSASATMTLYFYAAKAEVAAAELALLRQALNDNSATRFGMTVLRRLRDEINALLASRDDIPELECGWIPNRQQMRNAVDNRPIFVMARAEEQDVLLAMSSASMQKADEAMRQGSRGQTLN